MKIKEIASFNTSNIKKDDVRKIINYLDTGNLTENKIDVIQKFDKSIDKIPSRAKRIVKENDILISTVRPNQKHYGFIDKDRVDLIVSTGFVVITPNEKIVNPKYLYYYLTKSDITEYFSSMATTSTTSYPSITPEVIKNVEIDLPDLPTQNKIANLLSSLDDKIEINNRINQELEELGQALYTKWFVNYDFPNEEGKPYKSSGGEMIESELGMIPKGWKVDNILSIFNFEKGVEPGSNNYTNNKDDIRFIRVKDMETTSPDVYVSEDTMGTKKLKYISSKDITISLDGTIGKVFVGNEGCISSGIRIIKLKDYEYMIDYTYLFAKSNYLINSLTGGSSGSVIKHAGGRLNDLKIVHPNTDTLLKFQNSYNGGIVTF